jgi:uncharacterized protein (DUF3084 family)
MARFYGLFLLLALVLVSGLIAYVGDVLGRKLGRKRLSLFGLRPRYTAITVSVLAGMAITVLTLASVMTASREVRQGLLQMGELVQQVREQRQTLAKLGRERAQLERRLKRQTALVAATGRELTATQKRRDEANRELEATKRRLAATEKERGRLEAERKRQAALLASITRELEKTEKRSTEASEQLQATARKLEEADRQLAERKQELDNAWAVLLRVQHLAESRAAEGVAVVRTQPFVFAAGEALGQEVFPGDEPGTKIRARLDGLIGRMKETAVSAGAGPRPETGPLVIVEPVKDPKSERTIMFSEEQVLAALTDAIAENKGSVVVRGYSLFNTVEGEPVPVRFVVFQNKLVFPEGTELGEIRVEAEPSEPELWEAIFLQLLRGQVAARARQENVMPELPRQRESPPLLGGSSQTVGEISIRELYRAIEEAKAESGPRRVIALAARDIWTAGPMRVKLEVRPLS